MSNTNLNLAATCARTLALGPGLRAAVWVQGCPFSCPGCISPDWTIQREARLFDPHDLAVRLTADPDVKGLSISGGEPMMQAEALTVLVRAARQLRPDWTVLSFTGFTIEALTRIPPSPSVMDLLSLLDVLIDGQYVASMNDHRGLRGSANQRVHHFTDRLIDFPFETAPRRMEIQLENGQAFLIGIPPQRVNAAFNQAISSARASLAGRLSQ